MKRFLWVTALALGAVGFAGCGSDSTTTTVEKTVERVVPPKEKAVELSPRLEARFEIADELERRAERRGIEAETAEREGRQAEADALYKAGLRLIRQEEKVNAEIKRINEGK